MYPYKFNPILKSTIWGGEKIIPFKGLDINQPQVGESWEISNVPGDESVVANGAEAILIPEMKDYSEEKIIRDIQEQRKRGKKNYIIINAEGIGDSINMAKRIEEATGVETRATILGYMQRGGNPTCKDRMYASIMGAMAVDLLLEGKSNRVVGYRHGEFVDFDIDEGLKMGKEIDPYQYEVAKQLAL